MKRIPQITVLTILSALSAGLSAEEVRFIPWQLQTDIPSSSPCQVHVQEEPAGAEEIFPCGELIELDDPETTVWLEQGEWITPFGTRVKDLMAHNGATVELPLRPGAYVELAPDIKLSARERIEIRHYTTLVHDRVQLTPIIRNVDRGERVLMPSGANTRIALRYSGDELAGVTQRFFAPPATTVQIPPFEPAENGLVLAHVTWPNPSWKEWGSDLDLLVRQGEEAWKPDVFSRADGHLLAIWYDTPAGDAVLETESGDWYASDQLVTVEAGLVTAIDLELLERVDLDVSVALADDVEPEQRPEELHLIVRHIRSEEIIREADVSLDGTTTIENLPPLPVDLLLKVDASETFQRADLSTGDQSVQFELDPIIVEGTVTHGGEPTRAEVRFTNSFVETDEYGEYEITLWQPSFYVVRTTVPGMDVMSAHTQHLRISDDRVLDINVPRTEYIVQVTNAVSGEPISGANIGYMNRHMVQPEPGSGREPGMKGDGGRAETDERGVAKLPPLNPGTLEMGVQASGYDDWKIDTMQVVESDQPQIIEVRLQPTESAGTLTLLLPNGSPAAHARVAAVMGADGMGVWGRRTDERGKLVVPDLPAGATLIVKHPDAALLVRRWDPTVEPDPVWQMSPPAPPLTVQFQNADGTPAYQPTVVIWIDGIRIDGVFSSGSSQADQNGLWVGRNLPPQPLRILALGWGNQIDRDSPSLEAIADAVPYPWPPTVSLTVVQ